MSKGYDPYNSHEARTSDFVEFSICADTVKAVRVVITANMEEIEARVYAAGFLPPQENGK